MPAAGGAAVNVVIRAGLPRAVSIQRILIVPGDGSSSS